MQIRNFLKISVTKIKVFEKIAEFTGKNISKKITKILKNNVNHQCNTLIKKY